MPWQDILAGIFSGIAGDPYGPARLRMKREELEMRKRQQILQDAMQEVHLAQLKQEQEPIYPAIPAGVTTATFPTEPGAEGVSDVSKIPTPPIPAGPSYARARRLHELGYSLKIPPLAVSSMGFEPTKELTYHALGKYGGMQVDKQGNVVRKIAPPEATATTPHYGGTAEIEGFGHGFFEQPSKDYPQGRFIPVPVPITPSETTMPFPTGAPPPTAAPPSPIVPIQPSAPAEATPSVSEPTGIPPAKLMPGEIEEIPKLKEKGLPAPGVSVAARAKELIDKGLSADEIASTLRQEYSPEDVWTWSNMTYGRPWIRDLPWKPSAPTARPAPVVPKTQPSLPPTLPTGLVPATPTPPPVTSVPTQVAAASTGLRSIPKSTGLAAFTEWKKIPGNENKTIEDYERWKIKLNIEKQRVPSMGNAADLAIMRKFGDPAYLTDPDKSKIAAKWLATKDGQEAIRQARDDLTPPGITFLQTGEGFVPAVTRGAGVGTIGKPTGLEKPLPSEQIVAEQQLGTLRDAIERVKQSYDKSYVGFVAGRVGKFGEKTVGVGEKASMFYSDLAQLRNTLVYLLSGKQINEQEYERLKEQMPIETMPESTFNARMKNFDATLKSIIENRRKAMGGYKKPTETPTPTTPAGGTVIDPTQFKPKGK